MSYKESVWNNTCLFEHTAENTAGREQGTVSPSKNIMVLLRIINPVGWAGINCRADCKQFTTLIAVKMRTILGKPFGRWKKRKTCAAALSSFSSRCSPLLWSADLNLRFTAQLIPQGELHFLLRRGKERDLRTARFPGVPWEAIRRRQNERWGKGKETGGGEKSHARGKKLAREKDGKSVSTGTKGYTASLIVSRHYRRPLSTLNLSLYALL